MAMLKLYVVQFDQSNSYAESPQPDYEGTFLGLNEWLYHP